MNKRAIHILMHDYIVDSRVRNETETLVKNNFDIDVYCLKSKRTERTEVRNGVLIKRFGISENKLIQLLTAYLGMLFSGMKKDVVLIHCHDFTALPIGFFLSKLYNKKVIYDSHELWSESAHQMQSKFVLRPAFLAEIELARRVDAIITVSRSIEMYLKTYFSNNNTNTIRNIPSYQVEGSFDLFRQEYGVDETTPIFIYQGMISEERGCKTILEACRKLKGRKFLMLFLGDGPYKEELEHEIQWNGLQNNIKVLEKVKQDELLRYTKSADIGIHAIANSCKNHDFCLPNKVFEYLHAGIGILCSNLRELTHFINQTKAGILFEDNDPSSLADKMNYLIQNPLELNKLKVQATSMRHFITWENESKKLIAVYSALTN